MLLPHDDLWTLGLFVIPSMSSYPTLILSLSVCVFTLPRVIQREDCKNHKKRLAPLPTA